MAKIKNLGFSIGKASAKNIPLSEELQENATWGFDPNLDYGSGWEAISFEVSIRDRTPDGKKGAKVSLSGMDLADVTATLKEYDPDFNPENLKPAEIILKTIECDGEVISFKTSLEKHSRTVKVLRSEWSEFIEYLSACTGSLDLAVDHYRKVFAQMSESKE